MSNRQSSEKDNKTSNIELGWNQAIADAESMIKEESEKLQALRKAIQSFIRLRDKGVPFPGTQQE